MKSKPYIAALALFLSCAGVVQAAGLNGDYNGNPIVKVLFGGKELKVEDVPAVIQDGRTLVPLYLLRQAGLGVEWNQEKYSVALTLPAPAPTPDPATSMTEKLKAFNAQGKSFGATNIQVVHNEYGPYLQVDMASSGDSNKDGENTVALSAFLLDTPFDMMAVRRIQFGKEQLSVLVWREDARAYVAKELPEADFFKKMAVLTQANPTPNNEPKPTPTPAPTPPPTAMKDPMACANMDYNMNLRIRDAAAAYNQAYPNSPNLEEYLRPYKESKEKALRELGCS